MRVVAGLGNPGAKYAWTRHNMGMMIVQKTAERWDVTLRSQDAALQGSCVRDGEEVRLVLPQTYMNRSGEALEHLVTAPAGENLVVVYDDVDLPVGSMRIRLGGGPGGHRGVASVIERCDADFVRLRIGVGRPPEGQDTADFVLEPLVGDERKQLLGGVERGVDAVECILADGLDIAMNRFNGSANPNVP